MKAACNANESCYRRVITAIGVGLLVFLALINLTGVMLALLRLLLSLLPITEVGAEVVYQLAYGGGYLASFMLPVLVIRRLIQRSGYVYLPMKAELRLSPLLVPIILGGMALIWAQSYLNAALVSIFQYSEFSSEVLWESTESLEGYQIVLTFLVTCMVPAFCEEFLFRGAILTNCLPFGRANAILISALLFGLMHQNAEQVLYAFAAGIFLGVVYERTGSIWNCVFLHMINNFSPVMIEIVAEKLGGRYSQAASAALEGGVCLVGVICIAVLAVCLSPKKQDFREGVFGKSVPAADGYAARPVPAKRAFRLFLTFPMALFLVCCVLQIAALLGIAVIYGFSV